MKRILTISVAIAAALALGGCLSPAAQAAPDSAVVRCTVLRGQGAGSVFETSKADAVRVYDANTTGDLYCDVAP